MDWRFLLVYLVLVVLVIPTCFGTSDDESNQDKKQDKDEDKQFISRNVPLNEDEYDALFSLLSVEASLKDWPKTENKALRQRVYRKLKSNKFELREVHDPMTAIKVQRIVHTGTGCIVAKKSELPKIVDKFYKERKGEGARKINPTIRIIYAGLSRKRIQGTLN
ncbi:uncharacterized protein LOC116612872 [Nematostella vectensis]|uniref:uncharacterized protein LOC116612872 n=1 Tax=Nematostella vectensis TaxID=45351 RepID=UPI001390594C|nr:uncharacterized protein LOC116612872 [Nematostella vectensis]